MKKRRGQVLVLVLLVVVVALAVGLSVASRNLTNLRTTTQTEQSQRAFNAAEGGIEDVLSRITDPTIVSGTPISVDVGELKANVTVNKEHEFFWTIPEGEVGQVDLAGPPVATGTQIQIEWASNNDPGESANPASIELTRVYDSGVSILQERFAYSGTGHGLDELGFTSATPCSLEFAKCATISLGIGPKILRIRPFWNKTTVKVTSVGGVNPTLPEQQYEITSSATTPLGLTRKIQVVKTKFPQLPAVFDYVLYSEGNIVK